MGLGEGSEVWLKFSQRKSLNWGSSFSTAILCEMARGCIFPLYLLFLILPLQLLLTWKTLQLKQLLSEESKVGPVTITESLCLSLHLTPMQCEPLPWNLLLVSFWTSLAASCLSAVSLHLLHQHLVSLVLFWEIAEFLLESFISN